MASHGNLHRMFLVTFLVACSIVSSNVEARKSVFFSKMNPVRRYSQLVSYSMPALAPLGLVEATPAPAPALSEVEPAPEPALSKVELEPTSEKYVYGFYNREVGEFPVATTKAEANVGSQDENEWYNRYNNYENDQYTSSNAQEVNQRPEFSRSYRGNDNVHNYKYTSSYDDTVYTTNYNTEDDNIKDQYTDENQYYTDKFERTKPRTIGGRRFVDNGRYYNPNVDGYYRDNESANQYNPMEEYEGVYQP